MDYSSWTETVTGVDFVVEDFWKIKSGN